MSLYQELSQNTPMHNSIGIYRITIFLAPITMSACNEVRVDPLLDVIRIELVSMDEEMNETDKFDEGANFMLMLKATNRSNVEVVLEDFQACSVLNDPEFTEVYTIINNKKYLTGRCLKNQTYFCIALNFPRKIPAGESIYLIGARWKDNPDNIDLPTGIYFSKYTLKLNGREFHSAVEFSVN